MSIAQMMDKFTGFKWGDFSSKDYNLIITNNHDLTWNAAPDFSNSFTTSLGQNVSYYTGMEVSRQSITLKLFGHQLTAAKIREMLKQLDIYKIDKLIFEYDTDYYYDCKIDKISSITKSNIQSTADGVKYDIEFSITFTTVNDNYGLSTNVKSIDFTKQTDAGIIYLTSSTVTYQGDGFLPTEVEFDISLSVSKTPVSFILKENENTLLSFSTPVFANTTTSTATMTYIYNTNTGALTTIANSVAHLVKWQDDTLISTAAYKSNQLLQPNTQTTYSYEVTGGDIVDIVGYYRNRVAII